MHRELKAKIVSGLIVKEYLRTRETFTRFHSHHEAYAVILEELDELWDEIKKPIPGIPYSGRERVKEAIQVAAMAMALIVDLEDEEDYITKEMIEG